MVFLEIAEAMLWLGLILFFVFEVWAPLIMGEKPFPHLRRRARHLDAELRALQTEIELDKKEEEVEQLKKRRKPRGTAPREPIPEPPPRKIYESPPVVDEQPKQRKGKQ